MHCQAVCALYEAACAFSIALESLVSIREAREHDQGDGKPAAVDDDAAGCGLCCARPLPSVATHHSRARADYASASMAVIERLCVYRDRKKFTRARTDQRTREACGWGRGGGGVRGRGARAGDAA